MLRPWRGLRTNNFPVSFTLIRLLKSLTVPSRVPRFTVKIAVRVALLLIRQLLLPVLPLLLPPRVGRLPVFSGRQPLLSGDGRMECRGRGRSSLKPRGSGSSVILLECRSGRRGRRRRRRCRTLIPFLRLVSPWLLRLPVKARPRTRLTVLTPRFRVPRFIHLSLRVRFLLLLLFIMRPSPLSRRPRNLAVRTLTFGPTSNGRSLLIVRLCRRPR